MATLTITPNDLSQAAIDHREELLITPVVAANSVLRHATARPGVAGREVVGELQGGIALKPYGSAGVVDASGVTISGRTLETFLGAAVKRFDPNLAAKTVYGSVVSQGEALTTEELPLRVCQYLATRLGEDLAKNVFTGTTATSFFNGFTTIANNENLFGDADDFDAITEENAFDVVLGIYTDADPALQSVPTKMFMPTDIYNLYRRAYLTTFGSVPYNQGFDKLTLEGSNGLCELVPLPYMGTAGSAANARPVFLTTKDNMLYGYGDGLAEEKISIEKHDEFLLSFVATMYFGVQFASVSPNALRAVGVTK